MPNLPAIQNGLNTYIPFTLLISGSIGNILNCLIFTLSSLRNKPCRYASSSASVHIRSFSQLDVFQRIVCSIWIMLSLIWMEMFIYFYGNLNGTACALVSQFCNTYNNFSLLVFYSLLPPICMLLFGGMTIRNVRHRPINRAANTKDRQLALMLIVQVVIFQILSLPISIQRIYSYITINDSKTLQRKQLESLLSDVSNYAAFTDTA
ncbi:unnamed protein product [Adineta ricciae]|uniref:G-protein coupled receptors family 1 profile domain-containing protein n=1 Tax=Adineta ricciae TaxID=249248 RepID=A0A814Q4I7_ADIRI|nr:unnamed protein product [Adineta ricciae]